MTGNGAVDVMQPMAQQLMGRAVLVTALRRSEELAAALRRRSAEVHIAPMLWIVSHVDDPELIRRTQELIASPPEVVVVTTGVGFRGWIEAADAAGLEGALTAVLRGARLIARGPKARGALQAHGLSADWVAESETSAEVRDLLLEEGVAGVRVAVQHHGSGADGLDEALTAAGADVCSLEVYRWGPAPDDAVASAGVRLVADRAVDAVMFTSAPGAAAFVERAAALGRLADIRAAADAGVLMAAVGPVTAGPLLDAGLTPVSPDRFRLGALVRLVVQELATRDCRTFMTSAGALQLLPRAAVLDGRPMALSPTSLALLRELAVADGAVVSRAQLLSVLPGDSGDEHAVEAAIARLREGLGARDLVATVVKRGYRLAVSSVQ